MDDNWYCTRSSGGKHSDPSLRPVVAWRLIYVDGLKCMVEAKLPSDEKVGGHCNVNLRRSDHLFIVAVDRGFTISVSRASRTVT